MNKEKIKEEEISDTSANEVEETVVEHATPGISGDAEPQEEEYKEKVFTFIKEDGDHIHIDESKLTEEHHQAMADDLYFRFMDSSNASKALFMMRVTHVMRDAEDKVKEQMKEELGSETPNDSLETETTSEASE